MNIEDLVRKFAKPGTVTDLVTIGNPKASKKLDMNIKWKGKGLNEVGYLDGKKIIKIDPNYFRPTEVDNLLGDSSKAKKKLKWKPKISFEKLVQEMIDEDLKLAKKEKQSIDIT